MTVNPDRMAKKQTTNKLTTAKKAPYKTLTAVVSVDAPSGEGKQMQVRTVFAQRGLLAALKETRGHIQRSCDQVGITRETYYQYMKDPDFAQAVEHVKEGIIDDYMEALNSLALDAKFFAAIKYKLDNHAQHRGFGKEIAASQNSNNGTTSTTNVQINLSTVPTEVLQALKDAALKGK